jgi:aspartate 1-decarboxylase
MLLKLLQAKIHRATVTQTDLDYHGSITLDRQLLAASGLLPNQAVTIADLQNGNRFETYIIPGEPGSGIVGINGAAARLTKVGHRVIIMAFVLVESEQAGKHVARVVLVDDKNRPTQTIEQQTRL